MCYLIKFAPSVLVSVLCFGLIIGHSCHDMHVGLLTAGPCWMFSDVKANITGETDDFFWSSRLLIGQTIASLFLVLYIVIISIGFVHRNHLIWQRSPLTNKWWIFISIGLLISHALLCLIEISLYVRSTQIATQFIASIPVYVWCLGFLWPLLLLSINTFTKRHEIKVYGRQQRRARLEFGTKLGMNSPF
ncbi:unnamed protein product [Medioppia subpectinata]|nr:unnamed protein product [Medioppia subpectinata]CAG2116014.1 unnamed protein product [Medioppia subpectinata]